MTMFDGLFAPPDYYTDSNSMNKTSSFLDNVTSQNVHLCYSIDYPSGDDILYGYSLPFMACVSLLLNSLAIMVFMTTNRTSPTNLILTALALSDLLAIWALCPMFFIVYGLGNKAKAMKYPFCVYHDFSYYLAGTFHILSIWLTTLLAVQRYIVVAFPLRGPRLWTRRNSLVGIATLFLISFTMNHIPFQLTKEYDTITLYEYYTGKEHTNLCICHHSTGGPTIEYVNTVYTYLKLFPGTMIPCLLLTVTTALLISELKTDTRQILQLHSEQHLAERRDLKQIERTSRTIIIIAVCFLLMELPFAILYIWILIEPYPSLSYLHQEARYYTAMFLNFLLYFGSMVNFFIFITMSRNFRKKLTHIVCCGWASLRKTRKLMRSGVQARESNHTNTINTIILKESTL